MTARNAVDVARRCLCLELLLQRLGLETDTEDSVAERDDVRKKWVLRLGDLELEATISPYERALLERPVGEMSDDDLDDLHGRASGAVFFLWALSRVDVRPSLVTVVEEMEAVIGEHGLLGSGS